MMQFFFQYVSQNSQLIPVYKRPILHNGSVSKHYSNFHGDQPLRPQGPGKNPEKKPVPNLHLLIL